MMYLLVHTLWNGTIPLKSQYSAYKTKELAEKVRDTLKKSANISFRQSFRIEQIDYYQTEQEVPILNDND